MKTITIIFRACWRMWEFLLLLILVCFLGSFFWREIAANINEREPTSFAIEELAERYRGQYWLKLKGQLVLAHQHVDKDKTPSGEEQTRIYVPLVAPGWNMNQPIHAVVVFGPMKESEIESWKKRRANADYIVTGVVKRQNLGDWFADLTPGNPFVVVQDQSQPMTIGSLLCLSATLLFLWATCYGIKRWVHRWGKPGKPGGSP